MNDRAIRRLRSAVLFTAVFAVITICANVFVSLYMLPEYEMTLHAMSNYEPAPSAIVFGINDFMTSNIAVFITLTVIALAAVTAVTSWLLNGAIPRVAADESVPAWVAGRTLPIILLAMRILLPIVWAVWITALVLAFSAMLSPEYTKLGP